MTALLAAACATPQPGEEALQRALGPDARAYSLVGVQDGIAHYEKTLSQGPVARTQMAVCRPAAGGWRCSGPFDAVRVSTSRTVQRPAAARDVEDAAVLRLVGYLQSDCLERQAAKFGRRIADRRLTAIEQHSDHYEVALGGPHRVDLLTLARTDDACRFELRAHRQLTFD